MNKALNHNTSLDNLAEKLVKAWCLARTWLENYCRLEDSIPELCNKLLEAMESFAQGDEEYILGVAPCQLVDEEEGVVGAVYLSQENREPPYILLVSPTILENTTYAALTLLHELAHHLGFKDEDLADIVAITVTNNQMRENPLEILEKPPTIGENKICSLKEIEILLEKTGITRIKGIECSNQDVQLNNKEKTNH